MTHSKTIGEKGRTDEPLFGCPLCHRPGFSAAGLKNHRCHYLPRPTGAQRRRLHPDIVDAILDNRPPNLSGPLYL